MSEVQRFIDDNRFGAMVSSRIRKAYPTGDIPDWEIVRGVNRNHSFSRCINLDIIPVSRFIKRYGGEAYRAIPSSAIVRNGHRKAVIGRYVRGMNER